MNIYIAYFTDRGRELCDSLEWLFQEDKIFIRSDEALKDWTRTAFENADAIIFIGAAGIAVRSCAPFLRGKDRDPAVIVCDELERYVIPILSGHIGGANALALQMSRYLDAEPVITTATDLNGVWAADNWAMEKGFYIFDPQNIKYISSALLRGEKVGMVCDIPVDLGALPENVVLNDTGLDVGIDITPFSRASSFKKGLKLVPRCIALGVGCKKNTEAFDMIKAFTHLRIHKEAVKYVATIDIKKDERAVHSLCRCTGAELLCYTADELANVKGVFSASDFVKSITGVDNVCERAAKKASNGGELIIKKTVYNGTTIAACVISPDGDDERGQIEAAIMPSDNGSKGQ